MDKSVRFRTKYGMTEQNLKGMTGGSLGGMTGGNLGGMTKL
jgi:hypothetical protein